MSFYSLTIHLPLGLVCSIEVQLYQETFLFLSMWMVILKKRRQVKSLGDWTKKSTFWFQYSSWFCFLWWIEKRNSWRWLWTSNVILWIHHILLKNSWVKVHIHPPIIIRFSIRSPNKNNFQSTPSSIRHFPANPHLRIFLL